MEDEKKRWYQCEVCGRMEYLTEKQSFDNGWDYPPYVGSWGVVSPRTCPDCDISQTAWWAIINKKKLTPKQVETVQRIQQEEAYGN